MVLLAIEIGAAYISIIPSTRGMVREIKRSLNQDGNKIARQAGHEMGQKMGQSMREALTKDDPLDALRASADKQRAVVNEMMRNHRRQSQEAVEADKKARIAALRLEEATRRKTVSQSTLLSLQQRATKAQTDATNASAKARIAMQREALEAQHLARRRRELANAEMLVQRAQGLAALTRQSMGQRLKNTLAGKGTGIKTRIEIDGNMTRIDAELERITRTLAMRHKVNLRVDVDRGILRTLGSRIRRAFNSRQFAGARNAVAGLSASFAHMAKQVWGIIPGTWIIMGTLGSIAFISFAPLIASLSQVFNLIWLLPAAISGVAASLSALVVGFSGVFKTISAGFKTPKGATGANGNAARQFVNSQKAVDRAREQAARTAEDGAKRIARAERQVVEAQADAVEAQEDLNQARKDAARDLDDMNARLAQSVLDEESAVLGVRRAYESLRETMADPESSDLDKDEANLRYRESIARLRSIRRENAQLADEAHEANKKGVEGSDRVVDAQKRVQDANKAVSDAQEQLTETTAEVAQANRDAQEAIADAAESMQHAGDAGHAAGGGVDEFGDALAKLTPNAREFVLTVLAMRDAWRGVREATQEALFEGMGPAFERFTIGFAPVLETGLSENAGAIGQGLIRMMDDLTREDVQNQWSTFFANTAEATTPLIDGFRALAEVWTEIARVGSSYFPGLARNFRDWARSIRDAVNADPAKIHNWIEGALDAFKRLKRTAGLVFEIIYKIFAPGKEEGDHMWDKINDTLEGWSETLGSADSQAVLKDLFADAKMFAKDIKEIIEGTAKIARFFAGISPGDGEATEKSWKDRSVWEKVDTSGPKFREEIGKLFTFGGPHEGGRWTDEFGGGGAGGNFRTGESEGGGLDVRGGTMGDPASTPGQGAPSHEGMSFMEVATDTEFWGEQFREMGEGISQVWTELIEPVKNAWNQGWEIAGTIFSGFKDTVSTKWSELSASVQGVYDSYIKPTLERFGLDTESLKNGNGIAANIMRGDWSALGGNIRDIIDTWIGPAIERMKGFATSVKDRFHSIVNSIKIKWDELKGALAGTINVVIDTVWNKGLVGAWNEAGKFLPLPEAKGLPLIPGYAEGGAISGPGTTTSDSILARLSTGEHVWDAMDVMRAGGQNAIYAMRALIEKGIPFTWDTVKGLASRGSGESRRLGGFQLGRDGDLGLPAFRRGGAVEEPEPAWVAQLAAGHEYAQRIAPAPYVLGGSSGGRPGGPTDCSGYMGEIADAITGGPVGQRSWATMNFPDRQAGMWQPGLGPGFSVGIVHGGPAGGHTAGTLSAARNFSTVNVESGGGTGQGATYGGAAVGADHPQFTDHHHLKIGADGAFESAGGPSPEQQKSRLRKLLEEIFGKILDPIGNAIHGTFAPPPEHDGIPGYVFDDTREAIQEETFGIVDTLGSMLRSVYEKAQKIKDVVGNVFSGITSRIPGLVRDTGGFIPTGQSIVTNETGKPEAVLTWEQLESVKKLVADAIVLTRNLGDQYGYSAEADKLIETLENIDWEKFSAAVDTFHAKFDEIQEKARISFEDDALGVFGLSGIRRRAEDIRKAMGDPAGDATGSTVDPDMRGVENPDDVIAEGVVQPGQPKGLPAMRQERQAIETKLPDLSSASGVQGIVQDEFNKFGWGDGAQWEAVKYIVNKESTWNPNAQNPTTSAYGLFQFLDSTWAEVGHTKSGDPAVQAAAGAKYIQRRYGDPIKARDWHEQHNWYDRGGVLRPGTTIAQNDSGKNELVLTNDQWRNAALTVTGLNRMSELAPAGSAGGGGDTTYNIQAVDVHGAVAAFRREDARNAQMKVGIR